MGTPILAEVVLPAKSGVPRDAVTNTFAWDWDTSHPLDTSGGIGSRLIAFYNTASGTHAVCYYLSDCLSRVSNSAQIRFYDLSGFLDGSDHGSPIVTENFTLGASEGGALPSEVAICVTAQADITGVPVESGATRPQERHRGRIYLGPLVLSGIAQQDSTTKESYIDPDARSDILASADDLLTGIDDSAWSIWSRVDAALRPVVYGWIDDAWDTQRRRGVVARSRATFGSL
jgi:hypothetical protein